MYRDTPAYRHHFEREKIISVRCLTPTLSFPGILSKFPGANCSVPVRQSRKKAVRTISPVAEQIQKVRPLQANVGFAPGNGFFIDTSNQEIYRRLNFAYQTEEAIDPGVRRLAGMLASLCRRQGETG